MTRHGYVHGCRAANRGCPGVRRTAPAEKSLAPVERRWLRKPSRMPCPQSKRCLPEPAPGDSEDAGQELRPHPFGKGIPDLRQAVHANSSRRPGILAGGSRASTGPPSTMRFSGQGSPRRSTLGSSTWRVPPWHASTAPTTFRLSRHAVSATSLAASKAHDPDGDIPRTCRGQCGRRGQVDAERVPDRL